MAKTPSKIASVPVDVRAPNKATRQIVDFAGEELVQALYAAFDEFNRDHFGSELAPPMLLVTYTSPRAFGDHQRTDVHGLRSVIRIHPKTLSRGLLFARDVLLHEMVHVYQGEIVGDLEPGYRGHGPLFAAKCNEIGARLGLPQVGVKGRKGLPDSAQWPVNVRAGGYYGNEDAENERAKASVRRNASRHDASTRVDFSRARRG
jgi:hypothetical protein